MRFLSFVIEGRRFKSDGWLHFNPSKNNDLHAWLAGLYLPDVTAPMVRQAVTIARNTAEITPRLWSRSNLEIYRAYPQLWSVLETFVRLRFERQAALWSWPRENRPRIISCRRICRNEEFSGRYAYILHNISYITSASLFETVDPSLLIVVSFIE